jgi:hypothetical protein
MFGSVQTPPPPVTQAPATQTCPNPHRVPQLPQ